MTQLPTEIIEKHPAAILIPLFLNGRDIAECAPRRGIGISARGRCTNLIRLQPNVGFDFRLKVFERSLPSPEHSHTSDSPALRMRPIAAAIRFHSAVFAVSRLRPLADSL